MDKTTLRIVLLAFTAIVIFNGVFITLTDDPSKLQALTTYNIPVIGVITLIISLYRGKKEDDAGEK